MAKIVKVKVESDHDILIRMDEKLDGLNTGFTNHLNHHWTITVIALSAALTGGLSLLGSVILILIKAGVIK
jgi:hypothetical protein